MAKKPSFKRATKQPSDRLLPKITMAFFDRPFLTGFIWLALLVFGIFSYTTFLKREGFPSVNIPVAVVGGTYFVNDPAKVDNDVARHVSLVALKQPNVRTVQAQSADNFFTVNIQYKEGTDANSAVESLKKEVANSGKLPATANLRYNVPYFGSTGPDIDKIDVAISFYQNGETSLGELNKKAQAAVEWLNNKKITHVQSVFLKSPFEQVTNPANGQQVSVQRTFDRFGVRQGNDTKFYRSVIIGVAAAEGSDVIKLDEAVRGALRELERQPEFSGYHTEVSASFAPQIEESLSELQRVLLEGLLAVLVVGSIVIAIRASLITVVSMVTVILITLGFLYAIGYTLNVITLFALILGLALIVDDTIIMVEAIDAARRKSKDKREIVLTATRKISRAMVAATMTAALSFMPLAFVGGILGSFIRAIPVTLVAALIISLLVALIFIPFLSRFLLLGKKQLNEDIVEIAAGFEAKLAHFITRPMSWARHSRKKLAGVISIAFFAGVGFFVAGLIIARSVDFNVFPPTKDTNGIIMSIQFAPGTSIERATTVAAEADELASEIIGSEYVRSSYFGTGRAESATVQIELTSYNKRDIASPEIVKRLQERFDKDFKDARVTVGQLDIAPPSADFTIQIEASNRDAALKLASELQTFLAGAELKRPSGKVAHLKNINVSSPNEFNRQNGKSIVTVSAGFDGTDTTTLVTLAQDAVRERFNEDKVASYDLKRDAVSFDIGLESENQDSFKTLALAFPVLLAVIFVLLAIEFHSFLQPLLIFLAIPFSIFGVMLGLYLTDNAISFFSMLGFFALVGLSIKNTILLTDYANQSRKQGMEPIDAAGAALEERFRPLFATSITAVVSLIPLALSSPFWQGLAVVLIFGLLSSTFLVITVFPYYYIGAEYLRGRVSAKSFFVWFIITAGLMVIIGKLLGPAWSLPVPLLTLYYVLMGILFKRRLARK